jgi:hypothetical protein
MGGLAGETTCPTTNTQALALLGGAGFQPAGFFFSGLPKPKFGKTISNSFVFINGAVRIYTSLKSIAVSALNRRDDLVYRAGLPPSTGIGETAIGSVERLQLDNSGAVVVPDPEGHWIPRVVNEDAPNVGELGQQIFHDSAGRWIQA